MVPPPVLARFIIFIIFNLIITTLRNKAFKLLIFFKYLFKGFVKNVMFDTHIGSILSLLSLTIFFLRILINRFFLKDLRYALRYFILLLIALFFYLDMFDKLSQQIIFQRIGTLYISKKPVSKTYGIFITLPAIIFSSAILYILVYNLYDIGVKGAIYLSIDSNFSLRIGTHLPGWSVARPYCNLDAKSDNFYDELQGKIERIFTTYSYRYTWAFDIAPPEKHKVISWLRDRMYWSVEYQCQRTGDNFNIEYWEVVTALIKLFPIDGHTYTTIYEWRHDEFNFTPEGHRTFPRIVIKFYHD